jgi:HK97 family phage prohead protease
VTVVYTTRDFVPDPNTGRPAILRGYAAIYNVVSEYKFELDLPEVLVRGCFDQWLATGRTPYLAYAHRSAADGGFMASSASVRVWTDETGLAFEAKEIKYTDSNLKVIQSIARGVLMGCSWKTVWAKDCRTVEKVEEDGRDPRDMYVVRRVPVVTELGPTPTPAYPQTGCWLASTVDNQFPWIQLWRLARQFEKGKQALQSSAKEGC